MEIAKTKKDKLMLALLVVIGLVFLGVYLTYQSKFWMGMAGVLSLPFIFAAFLIDVYGVDTK
jgi:hypothetical protein